MEVGAECFDIKEWAYRPTPTFTNMTIAGFGNYGQRR